MTDTRVNSADVAGVFLFADLDAALRERIAGAATKKFPARGAALFYVGDPVSHFYYVKRGQVQLSRSSSNGDEKVIALISPGETFAEALIFGPHERGYPVDARLIEDGELIAFAAAPMRSLLRESTETCFRIMATMSSRLHELVVQIDEITLHSATYRLASFLLAQLPAGATHARDIQLTVPKLVIASRLSIQPETFSRVVAKLRGEGLLDTEGSHIVIRDVTRLRNIVAS